jgi:CBS domain-containing protein
MACDAGGAQDVRSRVDQPTRPKGVDMNEVFENRALRTGLLIGAPLLVAGSAASVLLYRNAGSTRGNGLRRGRHVRDIMARDAACCSSDTALRRVAELMVEHDCGEIPVCDEARKPIGVVTDRDIVCRLVATGHNPLEASARDCMSRPVITCTPDMTIEECARLMQRHQVRRLPVVDGMGALCGMVSQADVARRGPQPLAGDVVQQVSEPNVFASRVGGS